MHARYATITVVLPHCVACAMNTLINALPSRPYILIIRFRVMNISHCKWQKMHLATSVPNRRIYSSWAIQSAALYRPRLPISHTYWHTNFGDFFPNRQIFIALHMCMAISIGRHYYSCNGCCIVKYYRNKARGMWSSFNFWLFTTSDMLHWSVWFN